MFNSTGESAALSDHHFLRLSVNLLLRVAIVFSLIRKQNLIYDLFQGVVCAVGQSGTKRLVSSLSIQT